MRYDTGTMWNKPSFHVFMLGLFAFLTLAQAACYIGGGFTTFGLVNLIITIGFSVIGVRSALQNLRRLRQK